MTKCDIALAARFFEETVRAGADAKKAANWIQNDVARLRDAPENGHALQPEHLAELIRLVDDGVIGISAASPITCAPAQAACTSEAAVRIERSSRENMTTFAPSAASARATPLPSPLLAAATMAVLPTSPRSMRRRAYHRGL